METQNNNIYDLHINAIIGEYHQQTLSYKVSGSCLLSAIYNFGAKNRSRGDEIELEHTDQTVRVLKEMGIPIPTNTDRWMVVARPQ